MTAKQHHRPDPGRSQRRFGIEVKVRDHEVVEAMVDADCPEAGSVQCAGRQYKRRSRIPTPLIWNRYSSEGR